MAVLLISHPDVVQEPDTPVIRWSLSNLGVARMRTFVASRPVDAVGEVWSSTETKAIEAPGLLAARFGIAVNVHAGLGENDRTSTGILPPAEFEAVAEAFFARSETSVRGWETATAAQRRIVATVEQILNQRRINGDLAIVAHGAVGTLLLCALLGQPISRKFDQPFQGHFWRFDPVTRQVDQEWRPIAPR